MKTFIGIDPGITGAMAVLGDGDPKVFDLPIMAKGKGGAKVKSQINPAGLKMILKGYACTDHCVYLERVSSMPGQGVASMFSLGDTFGCIRGVLAALEMCVEVVTPQTWKKHFKLGSDKEVIRAKAIELFPQVNLRRKRDHNRAEALLIAKFGADVDAREWNLRAAL